MKIAVLASRDGSNLETLINQFHRNPDSGIEIATVISNERKAYALTRAKEAGIPTYSASLRNFPDRVAFDAEISRWIEKHQAQLIVLDHYRLVLQPPFVQKYRCRIINWHPTLLPAFPGRNPIGKALEYGVKVTGATVHFVDEGVDTGPIIAQVPVPVLDDDSADSLFERIMGEIHQLYPKVIQWYVEGKLEIVGKKVIVK